LKKTIRFKCKLCDKSFRLNHILNIHIRKKHAIDTKNTDRKLCLKIKKCKGVWQSHFVSQNPNVGTNIETDYKCQVCLKKFPTQLHLNDHVVHCKINYPAKTYTSMISYCNYNKSAISEETLRTVLMMKRLRQENTSEIELNQSLTELDASSSVKTEPKAKTNDTKISIKRFYCSTCKDNFPSMGVLIAHQSVHTVERPYICRFCDRRFSKIGYRKKHEMVHDKNINYTIDSNDNEFKQKNENQLCNQIHQDRYCSICKKQYSYLGAFNNHIVKMHSQKTDFNDNAQINPVDIVENVSNIKLEFANDFLQINCVCCNIMFDKIALLKLHLSFNSRCNNYYTHFEQNFFLNSLKNQCTICNKSFSTFNNRKRHIIYVHKILKEDCL